MILPTYLARVLALARILKLQPGTVTHIRIEHDDDCSFFSLGVCSCDPDLIAVQPAQGGAA